MRPLVCEVSLGEMLAFSLGRNWGAQKLRRLAELERHVVVVHISDPGVRQAYAELSTLAQSSGWSLFHGKNDLWVGAAARAADAHLLTMDTDFLPLRGQPGWLITVLDDKSGLPRS
jgi:predicted nucleic acid-binding protein